MRQGTHRNNVDAGFSIVTNRLERDSTRRLERDPPVATDYGIARLFQLQQEVRTAA